MTVKTNPTGQTCTVSNGSGTVSGANVTNVAVNCVATSFYSVGGNVTGLSGTVVLQDNGGDDLSVSANGSFAFATKLADGSAYSVTVKSNPTGQSCACFERVRHGLGGQRDQRRGRLLNNADLFGGRDRVGVVRDGRVAEQRR